MRLLQIMAIAFATCGLSGCYQMQQKTLIHKCETELKTRLKAPSSYKRIKITDDAKYLSLAEYELEQPDLTKLQKDSFKENSVIRLKAMIEYDAMNSFGTPLRDYAFCEYVAVNGDMPDEFNIKVNGMTKTDYMLNQVDTARQNGLLP